MLKHTVWMTVAVSLLAAGSARAADDASPSGLGSNWEDASKMPDYFSGMWMSRGGMVDSAVQVGYTEKAKAYMAKYKPSKDLPYAGIGCKTPGMPIIQRSGTPLKFQFTPGLLSIYIENASMTRFIHLNAKHREDSDPTFLGESVGHFEGDTLVVDTVNFRKDILFQYGLVNPKLGPMAGGAGGGPSFTNVIFGPHGPNLRMVERIRLRNPDTLEVKMTVHDDTVFTGPYEAPVQLYARVKGEEAWPGEWQCAISGIMYYDPAKDESVSLSPEEALKKYDEGTLH
jgi:hypothetical protein